MTDELPPLPERKGQPRMMTIEDCQIGRDIEIGGCEVGTWYSPSFVRAYAAAAVAKERERMRNLCAVDMANATLQASSMARADERERCAKLCEATALAACDLYGDGAECIATGDLCAEAIRATQATPQPPAAS